jgi:hypothetical protein
MTDERVGGSLLDALTDFTNLVLNGGVPALARPVFFGATLISFNKKDGGIRPIAVGLTLRQLIAKMANRRALQTCSSLLAPRQLGVGVKGGAEAIAHAARRYLASIDSDKVLVKLDFANAFNSIRRDAVLEAVALHIPEVLAFANSAYGSATKLWFGDAEIESAEGVQQGDPIGPLLFCLTIHDLLQNIHCDFVAGYLDDISIGGSIESVFSAVQIIEADSLAIGLQLNHSKCEILGVSETAHSSWGFSSFKKCSMDKATLLGAPIHQLALNDVLVTHMSKLGQTGHSQGQRRGSSSPLKDVIT